MSLSNREVQQRKTCQLYAYVLTAQDKEVPEHIEECADSFEYPIECMAELSKELKGLDSDTFEKIVNNSESQEAHDLKNWWEMYQTYMPLDN